MEEKSVQINEFTEYRTQYIIHFYSNKCLCTVKTNKIKKRTYLTEVKIKTLIEWTSNT